MLYIFLVNVLISFNGAVQHQGIQAPKNFNLTYMRKTCTECGMHFYGQIVTYFPKP